jgi:hypothetical protein
MACGEGHGNSRTNLMKCSSPCFRTLRLGSIRRGIVAREAAFDQPRILVPVQASAFDELAFFRAIAASGTRALLIGRRALIALGLPVMTRDYDFWLPADDAARFNDALRPLELYPTRTPDEARQNGRYVVEGDEHVDVLVARAVSTIDGVMVPFEDVWSRRVMLSLAEGVEVAIPSLDDLILTKKFGARPRDADDIRWLLKLKASSK